MKTTATRSVRYALTSSKFRQPYYRQFTLSSGDKQDLNTKKGWNAAEGRLHGLRNYRKSSLIALGVVTCSVASSAGWSTKSGFAKFLSVIDDPRTDITEDQTTTENPKYGLVAPSTTIKCPEPSREKYRRYSIILNKGLEGVYDVANVERKINKIVEEGERDATPGLPSASSAIEARVMLSQPVLWARLQPEQTWIIEDIRKLKEVKSVTATQPAWFADSSHTVVQKAQKARDDT